MMSNNIGTKPENTCPNCKIGLLLSLPQDNHSYNSIPTKFKCTVCGYILDMDKIIEANNNPWSQGFSNW